MKLFLQFLTVVVAWKSMDACSHYLDSACMDIKPIEGRHFLNQWIVEIDGGEETAKIVARETGFNFIKAAEDHENHYFFGHSEIPRRHKMKHKDSHETLKAHEKVLTVGQQYVWRPTLNQLEDYFDFVGHEEPAEVIITTFNPEERVAFYKEKENTRNVPSYDGEKKVNESSAEPEERNIEENANVPKEAPVEPLNELFDLKGMYALKQKMKQQKQVIKE